MKPRILMLWLAFTLLAAACAPVPAAAPVTELNPTATDSAAKPAAPAAAPQMDVFAGRMILQLEGYGFLCSQPEAEGNQTLRRCELETDEYKFTVNLRGSPAESINHIEAIGFYYGELEDYSDLTAVIFGLITSTASNSEEARLWVQKSIPEVQGVGDEALNTFVGISFHIYALPSMQVLEIGSLQD